MESGHNSKILWLVPEMRGGIHDYAHQLYAEFQRTFQDRYKDRVLSPLYFSLHDWPRVLSEVVAQNPALIHIQHEYGLFGSKVPPWYQFPRWVMDLKRALPHAKLVSTAHTVLASDFQYDWKGRGWGGFLRLISNLSWVPWIRKTWREGTWGKMDGVIVHSQTQVSAIEGLSKHVVCIPHFVPSPPPWTGTIEHPVLKVLSADYKNVLVFGFFSHEKGQDIAVQAFSNLKDKKIRLILAGGTRRKEDESIGRAVVDMIHDSGLGGQVLITGYLTPESVAEFYARADLVLAPFRETMGSGSLAQAFARQKPVLASDLLLNREIEQRVKGSITFFQSGNPADCARKIESLIEDAPALSALREGAAKYAEAYSLGRTVQSHLDFYNRVLTS